jgi:hypothetical protein
MMRRVIVDPLKKYPQTSANDLLAALGVLPMWANMAEECGRSMKEALIKNYPYYTGPFEGASINEDGEWTYPGDEPLPPIAVMTFDTIPEVCYFYRSAWVAVYNTVTEELWCCRMD